MISRRGLLAGLGALLAAPPIVRATSIMPVKPWSAPVLFGFDPAGASATRFTISGWDAHGHKVIEHFSVDARGLHDQEVWLSRLKKVDRIVVTDTEVLENGKPMFWRYGVPRFKLVSAS